MARSRVGGTKGKLSGALGDAIFYIVQDAAGRYMQTVQSRPAFRQYSNTEEQAKNRLAMATVERLMATYQDFITSGFENVDEGTLSAQRFAQVNYKEIREKLDEFWDVEDFDESYWDWPKKGQTGPRTGYLILSQGTLNPMQPFHTVFDGYGSPDFHIVSPEYSGRGDLGSWLANMRMLPGDQWVLAVFEGGTSPTRAGVVWVCIETNPNVNLNTLITSTNWRSLISVRSNYVVNAYFDNSAKQLHIVFSSGASYGFKGMQTYCWRYKAIRNGKVCYSDSTANFIPSLVYDRYKWQPLYKVKPSWLNEE